MAYGDGDIVRLAHRIQRQAQRLPHLALHFGGQYDARHAVGIVENFDAHPWEVVERVRICDFGAVFRMPRNGRAPRFQERLLACQRAARCTASSSCLSCDRCAVCHISRMENRLRIRVPRLIQLLGERRHVNDVMP